MAIEGLARRGRPSERARRLLRSQRRSIAVFSDLASDRLVPPQPIRRFPGRVPSSIIGGHGKRCFDFVAATVALISLAPLLAIIAAAIKISDRGPVLYCHRRVGWNGMPFNCIKFRTMSIRADEIFRLHLAGNPEAAAEWAATQKLKDDPRVTRVGRWLRKTSLDELPQLINILRGEMSFVGPRPIVNTEIPKYGDTITQYFRARPGLTGAWQVSGRNDVSYPNRVKMDDHYLRNWSFWQDLLIICKTAHVVLNRRGSY